jgi:hypothetical protein
MVDDLDVERIAFPAISFFQAWERSTAAAASYGANLLPRPGEGVRGADG